MKPFDGVIAVDWSAASAPSRPGAKDSIWIAEDDMPASHHRTREAALVHLIGRLKDHLVASRRVLIGFDFGFGYPAGLLPHAPEGVALWDWMASRVSDTERNENNRFEVASQFNTMRDTPIFWGRMHQWSQTRFPDLPKHRPDEAVECFRAVERHLRTQKGPGRAVKSAVHIAGAAGTVGSQIIMGLPTLAALKTRFGADMGCWPFEDAALDAPIVLAEIYPSLLDAPVKAEVKRLKARGYEPVKDAVQVEMVAKAVQSAQARGSLSRCFEVPQSMMADAQKEGWIMGATEPKTLADALDGPPQLRDDCFALPQGVAWTPVDIALAALRDRLQCVVGVEDVPLDAALGRVLAKQATALRDSPPTANSALDGYGFAHRSAALEMPLVEGRAAAGEPFDGCVPSGHAVRILTGAPIPDGVDTVVMQEDVVIHGGRLQVSSLPKPGANTRAAGEDKRIGAAVVAAGTKLRAPDLAALAATGHGVLSVRKRLTVGVMSTGNELAAPGAPVRPEQIYDANGPMLRALVVGWGFDVLDLGRAPDRRDALRAMLDDAAARCDAILTSGGASGGDEDHTSALLNAEGHQTVWRIAIKPGRPLALGQWRGTPVFGLPGNPVAAFVTTCLFARPAFSVLAGAGWREPTRITLPALFEKRKKAGRREILRARITPYGVEAYESEGSGRVTGISWANALIELPDEAADISRGDLVTVLSYESLLSL